jgi:nucleoside-diphosphate-sugar epimerase
VTGCGQGSLVILGGSGMLGREAVAQAVAQGWQVTVLNRGSTPPGGFPAGVTHTRADRADEGAMRALAMQKPDVVVDLSCYEPAHVRISFAAFAGRCGRYLLMSSGSVYAPQHRLPWDEDTPLGPSELWGDYARKKAENERLAQQSADELAITVLRPPYIVGPGDHMQRLEFILRRLAAGVTVFVPDTGMACIQFASPVDVAAACLHLAVTAPASGRPAAFNVAPMEFTSLSGLVHLVADELGVDTATERVELRSVGLSNAPYSWADMVFPFADSHFVLDGRRLQTTGFRYRTSLRQLVQAAAEPFRQGHHGEPLERYPSEVMALDLLGLSA